ncbi:MAG: NAD(P)/FAD-dependent oxidoreductase [Nitrososphaerales archaeon]
MSLYIKFKDKIRSMAEFDVVVVGGGHHGLIAACYLAKQGMSVVILERRHEVGGGLCTEEVTLPGFRHNLHSFFYGHSAAIWVRDLEQYTYGPIYIKPPVVLGNPHSDGKCIVLYTRDLEKSAESLSRLSKKDAQAYKALQEQFMEMLVKGLIWLEDYCPPIPSDERASLLEKSEMGREYLRLINMTPEQLIRERFEHHNIIGCILANYSFATVWHDVPDPRGWIVKNPTWLYRGKEFTRGGSHGVAHALTRFLYKHGGTVMESTEVNKIIVKDGRAVGVRTVDGKEIGARKAVISAVDPWQTFLRFVGEENLDSEFVKKVKGIKPSTRSGLFGVHLALREPPKYTSAKFNSDMDRAFCLVIGYEEPEDVDNIARDTEEGIPPGWKGSRSKPAAECTVPTLFDPSQAPAGKHTAFMWQYAPYTLKDGGAEKWDGIKEEYADIVVERWREYAPNLTKDNIIARYVYSTYDYSKKLINMREADQGVVGVESPEQLYDKRPLKELSQYRTPIKGLYLTGAGTHVCAGITGAGGYNVAGVVCDDLGVKTWWPRADVRKIYLGLKDFTYQNEIRSIFLPSA